MPNKAYYEQNRDKYIEYSKNFRDSHKDELLEKRMLNKEKKREYDRKNHELNKDKHNKQSLEYYWSHEEKEKENHRKYRQTHPDLVSMHSKNYIHRKRANGGSLTKDEWTQICNKYGNKCLGCGKKNTRLEIDHVIPIKLGGKHSMENVQPLCRSCNAHKHMQIKDYRLI